VLGAYKSAVLVDGRLGDYQFGKWFLLLVILQLTVINLDGGLLTFCPDVQF